MSCITVNIIPSFPQKMDQSCRNRCVSQQLPRSWVGNKMPEIPFFFSPTNLNLQLSFNRPSAWWGINFRSGSRAPSLVFCPSRRLLSAAASHRSCSLWKTNTPLKTEVYIFRTKANWASIDRNNTHQTGCGLVHQANKREVLTTNTYTVFIIPKHVLKCSNTKIMNVVLLLQAFVSVHTFSLFMKNIKNIRVCVFSQHIWLFFYNGWMFTDDSYLDIIQDCTPERPKAICSLWPWERSWGQHICGRRQRILFQTVIELCKV